jgi:hypothetical protein
LFHGFGVELMISRLWITRLVAGSVSFDDPTGGRNLAAPCSASWRCAPTDRSPFAPCGSTTACQYGLAASHRGHHRDGNCGHGARTETAPCLASRGSARRTRPDWRRVPGGAGQGKLSGSPTPLGTAGPGYAALGQGRSDREESTLLATAESSAWR